MHSKLSLLLVILFVLSLCTLTTPLFAGYVKIFEEDFNGYLDYADFQANSEFTSVSLNGQSSAVVFADLGDGNSELRFSGVFCQQLMSKSFSPSLTSLKVDYILSVENMIYDPDTNQSLVYLKQNDQDYHVGGIIDNNTSVYYFRAGANLFDTNSDVYSIATTESPNSNRFTFNFSIEIDELLNTLSATMYGFEYNSSGDLINTIYSEASPFSYTQSNFGYEISELEVHMESINLMGSGYVAIDNISVYTKSDSVVPEPLSIILLAGGLTFLRFKRKYIRY